MARCPRNSLLAYDVALFIKRRHYGRITKARVFFFNHVLDKIEALSFINVYTNHKYNWFYFWNHRVFMQTILQNIRKTHLKFLTFFTAVCLFTLLQAMNIQNMQSTSELMTFLFSGVLLKTNKYGFLFLNLPRMLTYLGLALCLSSKIPSNHIQLCE